MSFLSKPLQQFDPIEIKEPSFSDKLVRWFVENGKDYPWRQTRNGYEVLVSELMLQQTQIATVLSRGYYERWLEKFPDVETLAEAAEEEVLKAWEGLGYYNRARNLQKAATRVAQELDGVFPRTASEIEKLPGVGRYTAGAVASFAFGESAPIVDGNVARVLARIFDYATPIDSTAGQRQLWEWAAALVPKKKAREYNSALMELGQTICKRSSPACPECPVAEFCASREPELLPIKKTKTKSVAITEHAIFCQRVSDGAILLEQEKGSRRRGLWKLPLVPEPSALPEIHRSKYGITHYRVDLLVYRGELEATSSRAWFDTTALTEVAMAAPFRKAVESILQSEDEAEAFQLK